MRVLVGMSGGVDSSMAAALLSEAGHAVTGVTMALLRPPGEDPAVRRARRVAHDLNIPHRVVDLRDAFRARVIDAFVSEYRRGRTPNPCVICNSEIKFGALWDAVGRGRFDALATGHYVRRQWDGARGAWVLRCARDANKDQTYFLYRITQDQLGRCLFPLGEWPKDAIRELARDRGLSSADRSESQEICFVEGDYRAFLAEEAGEHFAPGPIRHVDGREMGRHAGLSRYTVGQRRGLGIAAGEPLYVVRLDAAQNVLVVGSREDLLAGGARLSALHWIAGPPGEDAQEIPLKVRIRYGADPVGAVLCPENGGDASVRFEEPRRAVAPGQAAVFYRGDLLLGGGVIEAPLPLEGERTPGRGERPASEIEREE